MSTAPSAIARIRKRFLGIVPRMILLHESVAKDVGLSGTELQVLHIVDLSDEPISPSELSEQTGLPRSTITRLLAHLEASGYVSRSTVPTDLRRALITTNPATTAAVGARFDVYAEAMDDVNREFTADELEVIARYWDSLGEAVDRGFGAASAG